jgi:hypothetical protein
VGGTSLFFSNANQMFASTADTLAADDLCRAPTVASRDPSRLKRLQGHGERQVVVGVSWRLVGFVWRRRRVTTRTALTSHHWSWPVKGFQEVS